MSKDKEKQSTINVQAYKFNGKLYCQWNTAKIVQNTSKHLILNLKWSKVKSDKSHWVVKEPTLWIFPKHKFYNALVRFKANEVNIYINLASPFILEDNTVKYIDFDLDLKICPQKTIKILDVLEFFTNSKSYFEKWDCFFELDFKIWILVSLSGSEDSTYHLPSFLFTPTFWCI
ncbi:DUF402 domain-containing protein [Mesomycoplasma hyorhinis]|uniref:DUF402 domain-containing protein n=1 Tax=Mesomycoplasma hyorhinis TaxID=2100 RepID=UPI00280BA855|nr:DUF402 domain-containing protein [Mesomycoplasma hyorhinis]